MNYKVFVRYLKSHEENKKTLTRLEAEINDFEYVMSGVSAVRYDVQPTHGNPSQKEQKRLEMIEKYNKMLKEYKTTLDCVVLIENLLNGMPEELKEMLTEIYVEGHTFSSVGREYGYSDHGLWKKLKRETEKYL